MTKQSKSTQESATSNTQTKTIVGADIIMALPLDHYGAPDVSALTFDVFGELHSDVDGIWELNGSQDSGVGAVHGSTEYVFDIVDDTEGDDNIYAADVADGKMSGRDANSVASGDTLAAGAPAVGGENLFPGDENDNLIIGTANKDVIWGNEGDDVAFGLQGADDLFGGKGSDILFGGSGGDELHGDDENDFLYGDAGADLIYGGFGNDVLVGGSGNNRLEGGEGDDLFYGGSQNDHFDGGWGNDTVSFEYADGPATVDLGIDGKPQYTGHGYDTFFIIDNLIGSDYGDYLRGTAGRNRIEGGAGSDTIDGGWGNDVLVGDEGNDWIIGGHGNDYYIGGAGEDTASFIGSDYGVTVDLSLPLVAQNTGQGIDTFFGVENVAGSALNDVIQGSNVANDLLGNEGGDWLWGRSGHDSLFGGDGDDILGGGLGNDALFGGDGADAFWYGNDNLGLGDDFIYDFENGEDKIYFVDTPGISSFSDITLENVGDTIVVVHFSNNPFGGSVTLVDVNQNQIGSDDFVFF